MPMIPTVSLSTSLPGHVVRAVQAIMAMWAAFVGRRGVTELLELDDRMLKDVGLVRSDVIGALSASWDRDPSILLRLRSVERRALGRMRDEAAARMSRARRELV